MSKLKVLIAGGGTGGHLFPAIAIGDALKEKGTSVKYAGSQYGIEATILPKRNETPLLLNIRGIQRSFSISSIIKNVLFPFRLVSSYLTARNFVKTFNPDVVIGTGGYSSGLPLLAATHLKKKTLIQEQNSFPGITTRKLAKKAESICIAYSDASQYIDSNNVVLTGNPVRKGMKKIEQVVARKQMGIDENKQTIFILGGSQGSRPLNNHFRANYKKYLEKDVQIVWQCGKLDYEVINQEVDKTDVYLKSFIYDMDVAYSSADIVISRAGALALSEMTIMGKIMVLVPFPNAAGNHQYKNAMSLAKLKAAEMVEQNDLASGKLEELVFSILRDENKRKLMSKNALKLGKPEATETIVSQILRIAKI